MKPFTNLKALYKVVCKISGILSTIKGLSILKNPFAEVFWGHESFEQVESFCCREILLQRTEWVLQTAKTLVIVKCLLRCGGLFTLQNSCNP